MSAANPVPSAMPQPPQPPAQTPDAPRPRVLSGMRPTGALHLGHYHGALKNWVRLLDRHDCFYFVADWHALTTHYDAGRDVIAHSTREMVIDWIAAGVDPERATIFVQSRVPEHAELFTLLAMGTPLGWLERVPTYKDTIDKLSDRDLATYGFLGYPLLQAADILIYRAAFVPVGEDQASHVELTREVARRFNHLYGRGPDFAERVDAALARLGKDDARYLERQRRAHGQDGSAEALAKGEAVVRRAAAALGADGVELLLGHLRGAGRAVLVEPQALHTEVARLPGLDGSKMGKSANNAVAMRDAPETVRAKLEKMPTDPQRVRRSDPGEPERCPVWRLHVVFSDAATREWVQHGCRSASIGCLDCKRPLIDAVVAQQAPWRERAEPLLREPRRVDAILDDGSARARAAAQATMRDVREAIGLTLAAGGR